MSRSKLYSGPQTEAARANFPFPYPTVHIELIYAIAQVKEATARANHKAGVLSKERTDAIVVACREIVSGKLHASQFDLPGLQGGAGTSIHMNVNEVIANRAEELLYQSHRPITVHPNDHVNAGQSTNDVNPTALRIALIELTKRLDGVLHSLTKALHKHAKKHQSVPKLARTHLQDAVPTTMGAVFASYEAMVARDRKRLTQSAAYLYDCNLGGTAIGNGINATEAYRYSVYDYLRKVTEIAELRPAPSLMAATSNAGDMVALSGQMTVLASTLSKIAGDLRFLASGPRGGIGEVRLKELQPGSSIMAGKVNPVLAEAVNQWYYLVSGCHQTIHQAAEAGAGELSVMFPILADRILTEYKTGISVIETFTSTTIEPLTVNADRCVAHLEASTAYATVLTPVLGYDQVSAVVKKAVESGQTLREVILEQELMTEKELDRLLAPPLY